MPPRARRVSKPATIDVGGVAVTVSEIKHALTVLHDAKGIMVRQPLMRAESPLAACDYHLVANEQRRLDAEPRMRTKNAFMRALARYVAA